MLRCLTKRYLTKIGTKCCIVSLKKKNNLFIRFFKVILIYYNSVLFFPIYIWIMQSYIFYRFSWWFIILNINTYIATYNLSMYI